MAEKVVGIVDGFIRAGYALGFIMRLAGVKVQSLIYWAIYTKFRYYQRKL